jgi:hypothetical protein
MAVLRGRDQATPAEMCQVRGHRLRRQAQLGGDFGGGQRPMGNQAGDAQPVRIGQCL